MAPEPDELFTVFGLGSDPHPNTRDPVAPEPSMQFVSDRTGDERNPVDPVGWRVDLSRNRPIDWGLAGIGQPLIEP